MGGCSSSESTARQQPTQPPRQEGKRVTFNELPAPLKQRHENKSPKTQNKSKTKHFTEMTIESSTQLDLNFTDDKNTPDGRVNLRDNLHNRIILLSKTLDVLDTLTLGKLSEDDDDAWPYDISVLNDKMALVTLPELTRIQCIKVSSKLEICPEMVTFEKECYYIHVSGSEIYVTLHNNPGDGEVRILDLKGKLKKQLGQQQIGEFMFQRPYHVTANSKSGWIYVTDSITCMVTCLKPDGNVEYEFKSGSLKRPRRVCVDLDDNLLVCGNSSNNVLVVSRSANGHFVRMLLSANDGIDGPCAIAYNGTTHQLIVGCRSKKLPVFSVWFGLNNIYFIKYFNICTIFIEKIQDLTVSKSLYLCHLLIHSGKKNKL